jgi:hypothetical protein
MVIGAEVFAGCVAPAGLPEAPEVPLPPPHADNKAAAIRLGPGGPVNEVGKLLQLRTQE